jgi:Kef-type K+ transport system membrane component KefB
VNFGPLTVVVAAGLLGPLLATWRRWGPPVVVGQIIAGVVIGNGGLGWVDPGDALLTGLANIGFALLMFVVGTHLPVRDQRLRSALAAGAGLAATVGVLAAVAGRLLAPVVGLHRPAMLAVLIATSSAAVALPVVQGLPRSNGAALTVTAWIAIADVASVLAVPVVMATGAVARVLTGGVLIAAAGGALYALSRLVGDRQWVQRVRGMSRDRGWGLDLRISLLALFACAWLATRYGTSILLAGFAVGAVVALLGQPRRVAQQLVGVGEGFVIPLFFVHLGAQLDFGALLGSPRSLVLAASLSAAAIAAHVAAGLLWRQSLGAGLLATAQLGVPAAVVSIGLSTNQLTPAQGAAVTAAMLVTLAACAAGGALLGHGGSLTDAIAPLDGS